MEWQFWAALTVMVIGVVGTVVPLIPGLVLIFGSALAYGIFDAFIHITPGVMIVLGLLTGLGLALDYFAGVIGAQRFGASRYGTWGAVIGAVAGLVFLPFGPFGIIVLPAVGVVLGEVLAGNSLEKALASAWGTCMGMLGGAVAKIGIGILMIGIFIWKAV
ncbi:MAG TPA: DUF456 family protein [Bacillota bacterium]|nr:DUF456 family protein [Bacillota bacterium]